MRIEFLLDQQFVGYDALSAGCTVRRVASGPASTYASIATIPNLNRPSSRRTRNHALSSSCAVLSSAPIQATSPAIDPPMNATAASSPSTTNAQAYGVGCKPTTSGPFMTKTPLASATPTAAIAS